MSHVHLTPEQLEAYAAGISTEAEERAVERETAACPACARALQAEARLELGLEGAARQLEHRAWRVRLQRAGYAVAAIAAAALVVVSLPRQPPVPPGVDVASERLARIDAEADLAVRDRMIDDALRSGLAVEVDGELLVPHYEEDDRQAVEDAR